MYTRIREAVQQRLLSLKREGSFTRNFAFTFSGSMVSLVLQVLLSPVLARIYSPEAYGLFAVFNSLAQNYALISSFSYTNAILVSSRKDKVYSLIALSTFFSLLMCGIALVLIFAFEDGIVDLFNIQSMNGWIYLIPVSTLLMNLNVILASYNIFHGRVKEDTIIVTSTNIFNRAFNLSFGLLVKGDFAGLMLGDLLAKAGRFALLVSGVAVTGFRKLLLFFSRKGLHRTAREYRNYPAFVFPSMILSAASMHLPIYLFSIYFSIKEVGYFSFASTLLYIPVQVLGNSAASIFLKKASDIYHSGGIEELRTVTEKLYWNLITLGFLGFSVLMMFGDVLFSVLFGERWIAAGEYAIHLAMYHIFLLVFTPLNSIFSILRKEKFLLGAYAVVFLMRLGSLYWGVYHKDALLTVKIFSWVNVITFLLLSLFVLKVVKAAFWRQFLYTVALLIFVLALVHFTRSFLF